MSYERVQKKVNTGIISQVDMIVEGRTGTNLCVCVCVILCGVCVVFGERVCVYDCVQYVCVCTYVMCSLFVPVCSIRYLYQCSCVRK